MTKSGKIALGAIVIGGIGALVFFSGQHDAQAATTSGGPPVLPPVVPPAPGLPSPAGGVVMVPQAPQIPTHPADEPHPDEPAPVVAPPFGGSGPEQQGPTLPSVPSLPSLPSGLPPAGLPGAAGLVQAKATLALWAKSDGAGSVTLTDYGTNPLDINAVWGPRDQVTLMAFQNWANRTVGTHLPNDGQPDAQTLAALQQWGVSHLQSLNLPPLAPVSPAPSAPAPAAPAGPAAVNLPPMVITAPVPAAAQATTPVPADTLQVVGKMLEQETQPHWRVIPESSLVPWQRSRGLTADGDYGTGTALKMAQETGLLPIVRGWPKGSYLEGHWLGDYRAALLALAAQAPEPRASQLRAAANREQGQGFGATEKPIGQVIQISAA